MLIAIRLWCDSSGCLLHLMEFCIENHLKLVQVCSCSLRFTHQNGALLVCQYAIFQGVIYQLF